MGKSILGLVIVDLCGFGPVKWVSVADHAWVYSWFVYGRKPEEKK